MANAMEAIRQDVHREAAIDRIAIQVRVEKRGAGRSEIRISDGLESTWSATGASAVQ
ncbi:MAG: hypothetical protein HYS06_12675 [Methylocystis sp.]|nr:hypothetical protein [Methylocystis sp.]